MTTSIQLREASTHDLDAINKVIEIAVMGWDLPERVKRLSLPSYHYNEFDLQHLHMLIAEMNNTIVAVAAWEQAADKDTPQGQTALLLHGLYVDPQWHRHGIGCRLFKAIEQASQAQGLDGLLVKAQKEAEPFFLAMGMQRLPVENIARDYANRFWKNIIINREPTLNKSAN